MPRFPKDPPVKNPEFMKELKIIIGRCEAPGGCASKMHLDCHHIRGRGLGGGTRKDTPGNLVVLCRMHHEKAHQLGVKFRPVLFAAIESRPDHEKRKIRAFLRSQAA